MNESKITTNPKWSEIKVDIKKSWDKLSDSDLEKTKGDMKEINVLLQKSYGSTQDTYSQKLTDIFHKFDTKTDPKKDTAAVSETTQSIPKA